MKWLLNLFIVFLIFFLVSPVLALGPVSIKAGGIYGVMMPQNDLGDYLDDGNSWGLFVQTDLKFIPFLPSIVSSLELTYQKATFEYQDDPDVELELSPLILSIIVNSPIDLPFIDVYAKLGVGIFDQTLKTPIGDEDNRDTGYVGGLGADISLMGLLLKVEADYHYIDQEYIDEAEEESKFISLYGGLGYKF